MKSLLKALLQKTTSATLQQRIRRVYLVWEVLRNREPHEKEIPFLNFVIEAGDHVLDVGANAGFYTKELSHLVGPKGWVYAFEPVFETYEILQAVIEKGALTNSRAFQAAVGAKGGRTEVVIPEMDAFRGYYWAHVARDGDTGRRQSIDIVTLDGLLENRVITRVDFVKCDVEGGEVDVLRGSQEILESKRPGWLMEVARETSEQVFGLFRAAGYRAFVCAESVLRPIDGSHDGESPNYFFFHPESLVWSRIYSRIAVTYSDRLA